jgi:hypothetical protein
MSLAANQTEQSSKRPLVITFTSLEKVEVVSSDKHRFYVTMQEAAQSCAAGMNQSLWQDQFKDFLADLNKWCGSHDVVNCYVAWGEGHLKVFITVPGDEYRFDLDNDLTDLEIRLSQVYPDHRATVLQLPADPPTDLASFFSPEKAIQTYGKPLSAPVQG